MRRSDLVPDCGSCAALCCVATSFEASEDFAFDKAAGVECQLLTPDCRCAIHDELVPRGFTGCVIYDCYGAGQRTTQAFAGAPGDARQRDEAFLVLRVVHELLWLLTEAAKLCPPSREELGPLIAQEVAALDAIAHSTCEEWLDVDVSSRQASARRLLRQVGDAIGGRERVARALVVIA